MGSESLAGELFGAFVFYGSGGTETRGNTKELFKRNVRIVYIS
jgi:hypothetical protein